MDTMTAYLAGIFDGEGYISISNTRTTPTVTAGVGMCCEEIIRLFHVRWQGRIYNYPDHPKSHDMWQWRVAAREAYHMFVAFEPLLIVKKPIISWAIELSHLATGARIFHGKNGNRLPPSERQRRIELADLIRSHHRVRKGRQPLKVRDYLPMPTDFPEEAKRAHKVWQNTRLRTYDQRPCLVCGITPTWARSLCHTHYAAWRRHSKSVSIAAPLLRPIRNAIAP